MNLFALPPYVCVCQSFSLCIRSKKHPEPLQSQCAAPQAPVCLCDAPACTVSPAPNACSPLLPKSFKKTHRGGGGGGGGRRKKSCETEREKGWGEKRGQSSRGREVIFFPPSSLLLLFSHLPLSHYLFLTLSPSPLHPPSSLSLCLYLSISLLLHGVRLGVSEASCLSTCQHTQRITSATGAVIKSIRPHAHTHTLTHTHTHRAHKVTSDQRKWALRGGEDTHDAEFGRRKDSNLDAILRVRKRLSPLWIRASSNHHSFSSYHFLSLLPTHSLCASCSRNTKK